ncbi:MAG: glycine cleavage system protein T [Bacteroidetes bacterium QS_8_68_28]|nr:MAG: glycine cleavage system protein T [Bacteroidetes bacterium QS_8_68_28]
MPDVLKQTPLHDRHEALGSKMTDFGGFDMPVQYDSIIEEHHAVRGQAGLFDISHMGEIFARGPQAFDFVQHLVTNDASTLYDGRVMYTAMCTPEGGVLDDLVVYRLAEEEYMLVVNAANIEKDFAWMQSCNEAGAELENASDETALLALQGPRSFEILSGLTDAPVEKLSFYHSLDVPGGAFFGSERATLSYTGYTGEKGLEIYCDAERAPAVWDAILEEGEDRGLKPVGLGARDTLRLEAGLCLYGQDLTEETNPIEAGLGWVVKPEAGDFVGRDTLKKLKEEGPRRKLVGFVAVERGIPRHGQALLDANEEEIGTVTSGTQSPVLEQGIGLGYVPNAERFTNEGSTVKVQGRRRTLIAEVRNTPFYK